MLDVKAELKGFDAYRDRLDAAYGLLEASLPNLAMHAGQDVIDYAQYLFRLPKHGNPRKAKDGREMIGSAPGEPPAIDTGALDQGLKATVTGFIATVNAREPTPYADMLEGDGGEGPKDRPYMKPAHDYAAPRYYANVIALLEKVI